MCHEAGIDTEKFWAPPSLNNCYEWTREPVKEAFRRTVTADVCSTSHLSRPGAFDFDIKNLLTNDMDGVGDFLGTEQVRALHRTTFGRRLPLKKDHRMGLLPAATFIGDKICVFFGGQVLYVLRHSMGLTREFIGQCYVHGLLDGGAIDGYEDIEAQAAEAAEFVNI